MIGTSDSEAKPFQAGAGERQQSVTVLAVLGLIGFTAVIAQIVLMRELMIVFCGNEMSLGLMLASWLLWTAIGSSGLGRWTAVTNAPRRLVAIMEVTVALAFPAAIFLARASKAAFRSIPGEILGPGPMALTSVIVLSAFCLFCGGLFAAGSRLYAKEFRRSVATGTSQVYLLEAVGSGLGGVLASLVLIRYLQPFDIAALVSLLNLLGAAWLTIRSRLRRRVILGLLVAIFAFFVFPMGCRWLERTSLRQLWRGYDLVATRNSVYGNLALVQTGSTRSLFENGLVAFNVPDPLAAEEAVHFALLQHPSPKGLLLVGGGVNGSLAQALQYSSLDRIDYVELDPAVVGLAQEYFSAEWAPVRADKRVQVHNMDGRLFLKTTKLNFDVVIINLPDPETAQLNRFYTREFFSEAASKLTPAGVFSFQLKGAEDYVSPELGEFLRCIYSTVREAFPEVLTIPGDTIHFLASRRVGSLTVDSAELIARLRARHIHTSYVREYYLPYRLMPDRMRELEGELRAQADRRVNRDFTPVAYYFDVALWGKQFSGVYRRAFETMGRVRFGMIATAVAFVLLALGAVVRWWPRKQSRFRASVALCVVAMGFTLMGLEMLLLLGCQAVYGYVYQELATIIAAFMVGMAAGSWWALRVAARHGTQVTRRRDVMRLAGLQALAATSPLLLYVLLEIFARSNTLPVTFLASRILLPVLAVAGGWLGGYQFPVASRIFVVDSKTHPSSPGTLYALDLVGACVGALLLSSYLIPVFGFRQTAWLMVEINVAAALLIGLLWVREKTVLG